MKTASEQQRILERIAAVIHQSIDLAREILLDIGLNHSLDTVLILIDFRFFRISYVISHIIVFGFYPHLHVRPVYLISDIEIHL